jgi:hypothetical protein
MLADQLDYVIGVDPHRDAHTIAVVAVRTGVVVFEAVVRADADGYAEALRLAEQHASGSRRAFAVEGTASFGRRCRPASPPALSSSASWSATRTATGSATSAARIDSFEG